MITYARFILQRQKLQKRFFVLRSLGYLALALIVLVVWHAQASMNEASIRWFASGLMIPFITESGLMFSRLYQRPSHDQRMASLLLLPFSRTDVSLGTFIAATLMPSIAYLVTLTLLLTIAGILLTTISIVTLLLIGLGALTAWVTLLALQFYLHMRLERVLRASVMGHLIPIIFIIMAYLASIPGRESLRLMTPLTLTLPHQSHSSLPGIGRYAIQVLLAIILIYQGVRRFARKDLMQS